MLLSRLPAVHLLDLLSKWKGVVCPAINDGVLCLCFNSHSWIVLQASHTVLGICVGCSLCAGHHWISCDALPYDSQEPDNHRNV